MRGINALIKLTITTMNKNLNNGDNSYNNNNNHNKSAVLMDTTMLMTELKTTKEKEMWRFIPTSRNFNKRQRGTISSSITQFGLPPLSPREMVFARNFFFMLPSSKTKTKQRERKTESKFRGTSEISTAARETTKKNMRRAKGKADLTGKGKKEEGKVNSTKEKESWRKKKQRLRRWQCRSRRSPTKFAVISFMKKRRRGGRR